MKTARASAHPPPNCAQCFQRSLRAALAMRIRLAINAAPASPRTASASASHFGGLNAGSARSSTLCRQLLDDALPPGIRSVSARAPRQDAWQRRRSKRSMRVLKAAGFEHECAPRKTVRRCASMGLSAGPMSRSELKSGRHQRQDANDESRQLTHYSLSRGRIGFLQQKPPASAPIFR